MNRIFLIISVICVNITVSAKDFSDSLTYRTGKIINYDFFSSIDSVLREYVNNNQFVTLSFFNYDDSLFRDEYNIDLSKTDSVAIVCHISYGYSKYYFDNTPVSLIRFRNKYYIFPGSLINELFTLNKTIKYLPITEYVFLEFFTSIENPLIILKRGNKFCLLPKEDKRYFYLCE